MNQLLEVSNIKTKPTDGTSRDRLEISSEMYVECVKQEVNDLIHSELDIKIEPQEDWNEFPIIASTSNDLCPNYDTKIETDEPMVKIEYEDLVDELMQDPLGVYDEIKGKEHVPIDLNEEPRIKTEPRDEEKVENLLEPDEDSESHRSVSKFQDQLLVRTDSNHKDKKHICNECKKIFTQKWILNRHLRIHTVEKPYTCYICEKSFLEKGKLDIHMLIHSEEKSHSCDVCEKVFRHKSTLNKHKLIHSGVKSFLCTECNKSFTHKHVLEAHERLHTGEKPFTCHSCKKTFANKSNFITHRRLHTGEKPYSCDVCSKSFTQLSTLNKHKKIHKN